MKPLPTISCCHVIIPCAGSGSRFDSPIPKQYHSLLGKTVLDWTLSVFNVISNISAIHVICQPDDQYIAAYHGKYAKLNILYVGGQTRAQTVTNALNFIQNQSPDWVLVHDAARCCIRREDIERLISALEGSVIGGILAAKTVDTLKFVDRNLTVVNTIDRSFVYQAQTPQMFKAQKLLDALLFCAKNEIAITDEASAMEYVGETVRIIECGSHNFKITHPLDLKVAEVILGQNY